jgi:hypothetical protein
MRIRGSGMEKIRIRDPGWKKTDPGSGINNIKHPGSATLTNSSLISNEGAKHA